MFLAFFLSSALPAEDLPWISEPPTAEEIAKKDPVQIWGSTQLTWHEIQDEVNDADCYESAFNFRGCWAAVNMLIRIFEKSPTKQNESSDENILIRFGSPPIFSARELIPLTSLQSFGDWSISKVRVEKKMEHKTNAEALRNFSEQKQNLTRIIETEYAALREQKILSFEAVLDWISKTYETSTNANLKWAVGDALNEIVQVKDPHAGYFPKEVYHHLINGKEDRFFGTGCIVRQDARTKKIWVMGNEHSSPAEYAGLKMGDQLIAVNGRSTANIDIQALGKEVRGPENSEVLFKVKRKGEFHFIKIKRAPFTYNSVFVYPDLDASGSTIARIVVQKFVNGSCQDIYNRYLALKEKLPNLSGVILDVRSNPGGVIPEAACVVGLFTRNGVKVVEEIEPESLSWKNTAWARLEDAGLSPNAFIDEPLVILVNEQSASAAEIVSGALQYYSSHKMSGDLPSFHRVLTLGTTTWGKGSVQGPKGYGVKRNASAFYDSVRTSILFERKLQELNLNYKETVAYYKLPSDFFVEARGITPDIERYESPTLEADDKLRWGEEEARENILPRTGKDYTPPTDWKVFVSGIETCMNGLNPNVEALYDEQKQKDEMPPDYQTLSAKAGLTCLKNR